MTNCSKCTKPIAGNTYKVGASVYCRACYACYNCNEKLAGQFLAVPDQPHAYSCQKCFLCDKCKKPIGPGDQHLLIGGGLKVHNGCLSCAYGTCGKNLSSKKFWRTKDGLPACEGHNGQ